ncbi:MAG: hypothetical protein ACREMU_08650, partial [Gemmatimonadaceae bacterium]
LGGRFVLAFGSPDNVPALLRAGRAFASAHGLAFERGTIAIYRVGDDDELRVEAGVRVHD